MVTQESDTGRYRLGPATLRLGNVYLDTLELRTRVAPWAEDLARRTGCAVRTGVLLLADVVVVHHEPRPDGTRQMPEVGIEIPAHASALGKALLAFTPDAEGALLVDRAGRRSMTGETVTEPAALRAQLAAVRQTGLAEEVEEAVLGECGVAAVLGGADGEVVGAVGLVVPVTEWPVTGVLRRRTAGRGPGGVPRAGSDGLAAARPDIPRRVRLNPTRRPLGNGHEERRSASSHPVGRGRLDSTDPHGSSTELHHPARRDPRGAPWTQQLESLALHGRLPTATVAHETSEV